ncbi:MAG TPA: AAA family ATPase [Verrucomicrobiae bacterium]|nr:AAA family ATPase [Verrucomicrobiae bacterium]
MRLYIVGGPGSGKSTIANALSQRLGIPVVHLDDHWSGIFERPRPAGWTWSPTAARYRDSFVADCLARESWIVEGAEPPFLTAFAEACDLIVWCDVPFRVAAMRMIRRHVLADLARTNAYPGYRRLYGFLRSVRRRYAKETKRPADEWTAWTRSQVAEGSTRYAGKVIRLNGSTSASTLRRVLERVAGTTCRPT